MPNDGGRFNPRLAVHCTAPVAYPAERLAVTAPPPSSTAFAETVASGPDPSHPALSETVPASAPDNGNDQVRLEPEATTAGETPSALTMFAAAVATAARFAGLKRLSQFVCSRVFRVSACAAKPP